LTAESIAGFHMPLKPEGREEILAGVAGVWSGMVPVVAERLDVLEQAGLALLEARLSPELREQAEREAHKLAGLLGTVGFPVGSRFALEMEHILQRGTKQGEAYGLRFSELVFALRLELEKSPVAQGSHLNIAALHETGFEAGRLPSLLIAVPDADLAERLAVEAISRGMGVETAAEPDTARDIVATAPPDVALLDPGFPQGPEQGLELLAELSARTPAVSVLVLTDREGLTDRVEVARRGGRGFLSRSLDPGQILEAVTDLWQRLRAQDARVMVVDDDPSTLLALRALLEPRGIALTTLDDPLRFWEVFAECSPDLLLLDVEMPDLNGIELCRVVRNDAARAAVPVIFLTVHTDAETVHRVFAAGADDFVSKPIVGPELVTRIFNRLERSRLHRSMAEIDTLTGVPNRRKSTATLEQFLRVAERYGQPLSLAVLTLDRFRETNVRYGHAAADEALRRVGQLLTGAFRSEDIVGRWGGSEFVIGMCGLSRWDGVQRLAELLEVLRPQRFSSAAGTEFRTSFSAGVAEYPEDGADLQALYRGAQEAARQATASGGDQVLAVGWSRCRAAESRAGGCGAGHGR
jgi:diguanylate cyclase (GGDEF)-like protein